jgi:hypothetical protein
MLALQVVGGAVFEYLTPAPCIDSTATVLSCEDIMQEIPIRGEGFAHVRHLNQVRAYVHHVRICMHVCIRIHT